MSSENSPSRKMNNPNKPNKTPKLSTSITLKFNKSIDDEQLQAFIEHVKLFNQVPKNPRATSYSAVNVRVHGATISEMSQNIVTKNPNKKNRKEEKVEVKEEVPQKDYSKEPMVCGDPTRKVVVQIVQYIDDKTIGGLYDVEAIMEWKNGSFGTCAEIKPEQNGVRASFIFDSHRIKDGEIYYEAKLKSGFGFRVIHMLD